jgi:hypothetical protein
LLIRPEVRLHRPSLHPLGPPAQPQGKGGTEASLDPEASVPSKLSMNQRLACPEPESRAGRKVKQLQLCYGLDCTGAGAGVPGFASGASVAGLRRGVRRGRKPNFSRDSLVGPNLACR